MVVEKKDGFHDDGMRALRKMRKKDSEVEEKSAGEGSCAVGKMSMQNGAGCRLPLARAIHASLLGFVDILCFYPQKSFTCS